MCYAYCSGTPQGACQFSMNTLGGKAQGRYGGKCVCCNPAELKRRCETPRLRKLLAYHLRMLRGLNSDIAQVAIEQVPANYQDTMVALADERTKSRTKGSASQDTPLELTRKTKKQTKRKKKAQAQAHPPPMRGSKEHKG